MNGEFLMSKTVGRSKSKKNNKITTKLGMVLVVSCLILLAVVVLYKAQSLKACRFRLRSFRNSLTVRRKIIRSLKSVRNICRQMSMLRMWPDHSSVSYILTRSW